MMLRLFCRIVGLTGGAFLVTIDASQNVGHLKKAIKAMNPNNLKNVDACKLQVFLAKTSDDKWLKYKDAAAQQFNEKEKHPDIQQMIGVEQVIATRTLQRWLFVDNKMPQPSLTEIHVLVVVPEQENQLQAQNVHDLVRMREANISESRFAVLMDEMLDEKLDEKLALLYHKTAKSYSNSTLGHREIARLEKDELFFDFAPVKDGEAFWTEKIQIQSDAITNEADFVAFVTPFFSSILESCGLVFVNSGRYPWLPQSPNLKKNKYLKPSGFVTHRGMYHAKPEPEGQVRRPGEFFRFGVAEEELFDCLILFESKLSISDAAFGQVVQYLQNLCPEDSAYAILFDRQSFWLIKSYKTVVCSVQKAKWITKGSKSLFQNFISKNTSPWVAYLTNACIALSVDVVEGDAFLARGSYGRVFKVIGQGENIFALKILTDFQLFRRERKALIEAEHTGLTIRLVSREYIETIEGWALLMYPVGKPLPRPETREEKKKYEVSFNCYGSFTRRTWSMEILVYRM